MSAKSELPFSLSGANDTSSYPMPLHLHQFWTGNNRAIICCADFARSPFFNPNAIQDDAVIETYVMNGVLPGVPGGIPFDATRDWSWRYFYVASEDEIHMGDGVSVRERIARLVGIRLLRMPLILPLP